MGKTIALRGQTFNRLTVLYQDEGGWVCQCTCGTITSPIKGAYLRAGRFPSCGCLRSEKLAARNTTHGLSRHPAYIVYANVEQRCSNPNHIGWKDYGRRGIKFEFSSFEQFWETLGPTYQPGLTLERKDNEGPYSKENCVWATRKEQSRNKRDTVWIVFRGVRKIHQDWADFFGVSRKTLREKLKLDSVENVFNSLLISKGLILDSL